MEQVEFMKVFWKHNWKDEPKVMFYEVDLTDGRYITKAIEIFADRTEKHIEDFYRDVIEVTEIPTADEFNQGIFGEEFAACCISKEEFEAVWNTDFYEGSFHKNIP